MLEKELKAPLDAQTYARVLDAFAWQEQITQINHYYDNAGQMHTRGITVRVREKPSGCKLQIKVPQGEQSALHVKQEYQAPLRAVPSLLDGNTLKNIADVDAPDVYHLGTLTTHRKRFIWSDGTEIYLDESHYLGCTDYEIELEYVQDAVDAALLQQLATFGVSFDAHTPGKFSRFMTAHRGQSTSPFSLDPHCALYFESHCYSAMDIERRVNQFIACLLGKGCTPATTVAIALPRCPDFVFAMLACRHIGLPMLPLDVDVPDARLTYMLDDSDVQFVLTTDDCGARFSGKNIILPPGPHFSDIYLPTDFQPSSVLYTLYTSGTTGNPKGVQVPRGALEAFTHGVRDRIHLLPGERMLGFANVAFDIFLLETLVALDCGLEVVLASDTTMKNPRAMIRLIEQSKADVLQITPSGLQMLCQADQSLNCLRGIKKLLLGAEPLPPALLTSAQTLTGARIYNLYGPTEATVFSSIADMTHAKIVHIGTPLEGEKLYVLDESLSPVLLGDTGQLAIAGRGLAIGYHNNATLTAEKFVVLSDNTRAYLTGDLGYQLEDGTTICLGRMDDQLKISGHRIAPGEIESALSEHPAVQQTLVCACGKEKNVLAAFYSGEQEIPPETLHSFLSNILPQYMVPSVYVYVQQIPLTPNGKADRKALLARFESMPMPSAIPSATQDTSLHRAVGDVIIAHLPTPLPFDWHAELTTLGFDSLTYVQMIIALEQAFSVNLGDDHLIFSSDVTSAKLADAVKKALEVNANG